jgi:hypothetical protein
MGDEEHVTTDQNMKDGDDTADPCEDLILAVKGTVGHSVPDFSHDMRKTDCGKQKHQNGIYFFQFHTFLILLWNSKRYMSIIRNLPGDQQAERGGGGKFTLLTNG